MKICRICSKQVLRTCSESRSGVCEDCQILASTSRALFQSRGTWLAKVTPQCQRLKPEGKGAKAS